MSGRGMTTAAELRAAKRAALRTELARLRFDAGLTVREVCQAVGIPSTSTLSNWENGLCKPRRMYANALLTFYGQSDEVNGHPERTGTMSPTLRISPAGVPESGETSPTLHAGPEAPRADSRTSAADGGPMRWNALGQTRQKTAYGRGK